MSITSADDKEVEVVEEKCGLLKLFFKENIIYEESIHKMLI